MGTCGAKIFKIAVHFEWWQAALRLLFSVQKQYLSQGETPPEDICKAGSAAESTDQKSVV